MSSNPCVLKYRIRLLKLLSSKYKPELLVELDKRVYFPQIDMAKYVPCRPSTDFVLKLKEIKMDLE